MLFINKWISGNHDYFALINFLMWFSVVTIYKIDFLSIM